MESLGTGRKGAERGRNRQEEAFLPPVPVPSDSIAGPPKKGKKSLAYPARLFYLFTFLPFYLFTLLPLSV